MMSKFSPEHRLKLKFLLGAEILGADFDAQPFGQQRELPAECSLGDIVQHRDRFGSVEG